MAVSKAQQKAVNKYMSANYDRVNVTMPKGRKDAIKAYAMIRGESVNGFINRAIQAAMGLEPLQSLPESREGVSGVGDDILSPQAIKAAKEAAEAAGEDLRQFVQRAIATQAQRDRTSLKLGILPAESDPVPKPIQPDGQKP